VTIIRTASPVCLAIAAALLVTAAQAAPARGSLQQLLMRQYSGAVPPPEELPPVRSPKPYRAVVEKPCDESECTLKFGKVAPSRLLEISNVSCITIQNESDDGKFFVLSKSARLDKPQPIIAILPATGIAGTTVTTSQPGPFYIDAGESPFLSASSPGSGIGMICTLSGTLWRTD